MQHEVLNNKRHVLTKVIMAFSVNDIRPNNLILSSILMLSFNLSLLSSELINGSFFRILLVRSNCGRLLEVL